jgi:putrescine---pyruvate transaminase
VRELSPYFFEQLETLRDLPLVGDVRGMGLMVCVEFVSNQDTHEGFPDDVDEIVNGLRVAIIAVQPQLLR